MSKIFININKFHNQTQMKKLVYIFLLITVVASCSQKKTRSREGHIENISKHEMFIDSIRKTRTVTTDEMFELMDNYYQFQQKYKQDSLSPVYLYRAAEAALYINQGIKAIAYLKQIESGYPDFSNMSNVIFLIGFTYDNNEKNYDAAREYYEKFLEKYPDHPLANDTKILIENLGKSLEEIIKEFEAKNKSN